MVFERFNQPKRTAVSPIHAALHELASQVQALKLRLAADHGEQVLAQVEAALQHLFEAARKLAA